VKFSGRALHLCLLVAALPSCSGERKVVAPNLGDPERGQVALDGFGCGACHVIPGVRAARGMVGPPLTGFARRSYIAGQLVNSPDNLVRWIAYPQAVEPGTAMPTSALLPRLPGTWQRTSTLFTDPSNEDVPGLPWPWNCPPLRHLHPDRQSSPKVWRVSW
jgi:cytochrome c